MDLPRVEYIEGNEQLLDEARILWEELIQDHRVKLKHFTSGYHNRNFDDGKAGLVEKAKTAVLTIDLVKDSDKDKAVGYCICSVRTGFTLLGVYGKGIVMGDLNEMGI